jgi:hypothetical protein
MKDTTEDFGVQGLHPSPEDGGIGGEVFHGGNGNAEAFNEVAGASGGVYFDSEPMEGKDDFVQMVLVIDRNQG